MTRIKAGSKPSGPQRNHNIQKSKGGNKPKGGNDGGKKKGGGGQFFGGAGGWRGVPVRQARRIVDGQIRRDVTDMRSQRNQVAKQTDKLIRDAESDYTRGKGDLEHIFNETQDYIGHQNQQINERFTGARTQSQAIRNSLMGQLQRNAGSVGNMATSELDRLNLGNNDQFMAQYAADVSNNADVANINSANNDAILNAMASGASSIGDLLLGMNAGSHNANQGRILNNRNDAVSTFREDFNQQQAKINDAIRSARNSRGDLLNELLLQMQQTGWAQYMDRQNLGLQRRQLNLQAQDQRFSQNMARRSAGSSGGSSSNGGSSGGGSSSVGSGGGKVNGVRGGSSGLQAIVDVLSGKGPRK